MVGRTPWSARDPLIALWMLASKKGPTGASAADQGVRPTFLSETLQEQMVDLVVADQAVRALGVGYVHFEDAAFEGHFLFVVALDFSVASLT